MIRKGKVSSCSPDASVCGSHGWEREREEDENNGNVLLKQAVSKVQSRESKLLSLLESGQDWREWALKTHARASVGNMAPYVF